MSKYVHKLLLSHVPHLDDDVRRDLSGCPGFISSILNIETWRLIEEIKSEVWSQQ